ncbi:MAG: 3-oxoacid CoA-transferase subunit A [Myxococcota bacterium]|nr:3-oxoacid CoA-transferase subunit A [Myxococcota bacterium]
MSGKVVADMAAALAGLQSGMTVAVSGFGLSSNPEALIAGVLDTGATDLTLISNNAGAMGRGLARWLQAGIVSRVVCTYVGSNLDLQRAMDDGSVAVDLIPQGTFVERLRAAGAGIAGFYTPTGVGTVAAHGKEERTFEGRRYLLERPLHADLALIRAFKADPFGNVRFWGTSANFAPAMAMAAAIAVVEAEQVVPLGGIAPGDVHLPGAFTQRVLHVSQHTDHIEKRTVREPT